jgi:hypothetical protein
MESSEMLDVFHYLFEDDMRFTTGDEAKAQGSLRKELYRLYGKEYQYGSSGSGETYGGRAYISSDSMDDFDSSPSSARKPYVAPTNFNPESSNPYGSVLDAPLG